MDFEKAIVAYAKCMEVSLNEAREDAEAIIKDSMASNGWTREFAEASFIEDTLDGMEDAVGEMTQAAKENGTDKITAKSVDAYGKKRTRMRKPNDEKRNIIEKIYDFIMKKIADTFYNSDGTLSFACEIVNPERQIDFFIGNNHYSLTLTQHRLKKDKN